MDGLVKMVSDGLSLSVPAFHFSEGVTNWTGLIIFLLLGIFIYADCVMIRKED